MVDTTSVRDFEFVAETSENVEVPPIGTYSFLDEAISCAQPSLANSLRKKVFLHDSRIVATDQPLVGRPINNSKYNPIEAMSKTITDILTSVDDVKWLTEIDGVLHEGRMQALGGKPMITATLYQKLIQDPEFLTDLNEENMWEKFVEARRCYRLAHDLGDDGMRVYKIPAKHIVETEKVQLKSVDELPLTIDATDPFSDVEIKEIPEDASNFKFYEIPETVTIQEHEDFLIQHGCGDSFHESHQQPINNVRPVQMNDFHDLVDCDRKFLQLYTNFVNEKSSS